MNALAHKLHEIAIVLENEATFHEMYKACAGESHARARTVIVTFANRFAVAPAGVLSASSIDGPANREHLRRYFDDIYDIKDRVGSSGFLELPLFAFWEDRVKNADPVKPKAPTVKTTLPSPGDRFDASFASRDYKRRARHGMFWSESELEKLCALSAQGLSLESMCLVLQRPADGVINKLRQTGMVAVDLNHGNYPVYAYTKNILKYQSVDLKSEIDEHLNRAQAHFSKVDEALAELPVTPTEEGQPTMSNKATIIEVTTKTLVNGKDIKDFSDAEVYQLIADQEAEIARLEAIKAKPKKLVAEIAKRQEGIAALVAHLDSKE